MSNKQKVDVIAKLMNISARRVQQLSQDGIIPKPDKGKYDVLKCFIGYVRYLQNQKNDRPIDKARDKLIQLQCEKLEMDLKTKNRETVETEEVIRVWSDMILKFRARMLTIPGKGAVSIVNESKIENIEKTLKTLIYEALDEMSQLTAKDFDVKCVDDVDAEDEQTK